jgi:hypothetical protein
MLASKGREIRCTVPGLTPNRSATTRTPGLPGSFRAFWIRFSSSGASRGSAELLALAYGPLKAGTDPFLDHGPFELGKYAHHLKHCLAGRRRGVEPLLMQVEVNPQRVNFGQEADQVLQAASEPVDRPRHDHAELPLGGVSAERIKAGAFVAPLGAADAVIFVDLDDLTAHAAGDLAQLALLVCRRLIDG